MHGEAGLSRHLEPGAYAAVLFFVGLVLSVPVVRLRLRAIEWVPRMLLRLVVRLMGPSPAVTRMALAIWLFNSAVMFLCMASGFHPSLPAVLCIWTGINVGLMAFRAATEGEPALEALARPGAAAWRPPGWLAAAGGVLVLLIELPCFWYAVAMGVTLGWDVSQPATDYVEALAPRASVYLSVIVPALLLSAIAESLAIRGASTPQ